MGTSFPDHVENTFQVITEKDFAPKMWFRHFCVKEVFAAMWVYFWVLYSIHLTQMLNFVLISYSFHYYDCCRHCDTSNIASFA